MRGGEVEICNRILQFDFPASCSILQISKGYVSGLLHFSKCKVNKELKENLVSYARHSGDLMKGRQKDGIEKRWVGDEEMVDMPLQ